MDRNPLPRLNTFAGLSHVLDRVAERRDESMWVGDLAASAQARYLAIDPLGETYLHPGRPALRWLDVAERERWLGDLKASFLGFAHEQPRFLLTVDDDARAAELATLLDARRASLREVGLQLPADEAGLFAYGKGLAHWQRETRHCAYCGAPVVLVASGHRAQCTNNDCGRMHFPRTDAAVIVIVEYEGRCLLGRQAGWPKGRYSTLAGFVEPGEALEDAVRREVAEESGVLVGEVRYHSSQPWPLPQSLMVGFTAKAVSPEIRLRDRELEEARWFTPQDIVDGLANGSFLPSPPLSVSYHLLSHWLQQQAGTDLDTLVAQYARR
ncbi:NAD(+) diphosphatase [Dyella sedimenti]|uniref:NAD(+) diphosphatase n=1 Tax=Dyella sedimenti TaxID=2919947 RepID=UPI001FAB27F5|nr:NAD(+) diphosphatase [Dyella sedimenti]